MPAQTTIASIRAAARKPPADQKRKPRSTASPWQTVMDVVKFPAYLGIVNVLLLVASILLITWFAAAVAAYDTIWRFRVEGDEHVVGNFIASMRTGIRRKLLVGAGSTVVLAVLGANVLFLGTRPQAVAFPLLMLNIAFVLTWVTTTSALLGSSRTMSGSGWTQLRSALLIGVTPSIRNVIVVGTVAAAAALSVLVPVLGFFFSGSVVVLVIVLTDGRAGRGATSKGNVS